jgi:pilus assembly protein CpaB
MATTLKNPRILLLLMLAAVIIAGAAQWALSATRTPTPAAAPAVAAAPATSLVILARALPPGHMIQPGDLSELPWTASTPPAGAVLTGSPQARELVGAVTRRSFVAGELLLPAAVIRPGERGFLAAVIEPGHRAVAIAVEAATAAGGLIWPGDHVDVVLTQELRDDSVPLGQRVLSETILTDVRILSTDQKLDSAAETPTGPEAVAAPRAVPTTVTLEVTPAEAERLAVGATLGTLQLALRAVDGGKADAAAMPDTGTWAGTVSPGLQSVRRRPTQPLSAPPAPVAAPRETARSEAVQIYRGSQGVAK